MGYGADRRRRRSIRLKGYDYSQAGAYFVTICTEDREWVLGEVVAGEMRPNDAGAVALAVWEDLPRHYAHVRVDTFVVMPNHVHGIIVLIDDVAADVGADVAGVDAAGLGVGAGLKPAPTADAGGVGADVGAGLKPAPTKDGRRQGLPEVVRAFKTFSARRINELRGMPGVPVWQRNYYEHVVRDERALNAIRQYIADNPARWVWDRYNPEAAGPDAQAAELWRMLRE